MNSVRVYIATTEGPSEVLGIAKEDPEGRSVMCLDGTPKQVPISKNYNAFVRQGSGVVAKHFGHPVFRMDVSETIDDGRSWELGVFTAHALFATDCLAKKQAAVTQAVWISGEVSHDLQAGPIEDVNVKLHESGRLFSELKAAGTPITILLPRGNAAELDRDWFKQHGFGKNDIRITAVDTAGDVCRHLGLKDPLAPEDENAKPPVKSWIKVSAVAGAVGAAALVAAVGVWRSGFGDWAEMAEQGRFRDIDAALEKTEKGDCLTCSLSARAFQAYADFIRPGAGDLRLMAFEKRAPGSRSCSALSFGRTKPVEEEVAIEQAGRLAPSAAKGLCAVIYRLANAGDEPVHVWLSAVPEGQDSLPFRNGPAAAAETVAPGEALSVEVPMPRWLRRSLSNKVTAVVAPRASDELSAWLVPGEGKTAPDWLAMRERLERTGLSVLTSVHEVIP